MRPLDDEGLASWSERNGYDLSSWNPSLPSAARRLEVPAPGEPYRLIRLLDALVNLTAGGGDRLIWLRDSNIWDDRSQELGLYHWDLLLKAYGLPGGPERCR